MVAWEGLAFFPAQKKPVYLIYSYFLSWKLSNSKFFIILVYFSITNSRKINPQINSGISKREIIAQLKWGKFPYSSQWMNPFISVWCVERVGVLLKHPNNGNVKSDNWQSA